LKQAYDLLSATEPFVRWNLPDSEDMKFTVARDKTCFGWHDKKANGPHRIAVSAARVGNLFVLLATMAHEMVHVHEHRIGMRGKAENTIAFKKFAADVCRVHNCFDLKSF
jgi:hypothetical protein